MRTKLVLLAGPLLALTLVAAPPARADYYYNFDPVDATIYSDNAGMRINIDNQPQVGPIKSGVDTNIVAATLTTAINQGVAGIDAFNKSTQLKLTITDGSEAKSILFGLKFTGSLSAQYSQIKVAFDGAAPEPIMVNGNRYSVSLNSIVPPGVPGAIKGSVGGTIVAGIHNDPDPGDPGDPPPTNNTPEPSSMLLGALGASLLGASGVKRWRRRAA